MERIIKETVMDDEDDDPETTSTPVGQQPPRFPFSVEPTPTAASLLPPTPRSSSPASITTLTNEPRRQLSSTTTPSPAVAALPPPPPSLPSRSILSQPPLTSGSPPSLPASSPLVKNPSDPLGLFVKRAVPPLRHHTSTPPPSFRCSPIDCHSPSTEVPPGLTSPTSAASFSSQWASPTNTTSSASTSPLSLSPPQKSLLSQILLSHAQPGSSSSFSSRSGDQTDKPVGIMKGHDSSGEPRPGKAGGLTGILGKKLPSAIASQEKQTASVELGIASTAQPALKFRPAITIVTSASTVAPKRPAQLSFVKPTPIFQKPLEGPPLSPGPGPVPALQRAQSEGPADEPILPKKSKLVFVDAPEFSSRNSHSSAPVTSCPETLSSSSAPQSPPSPKPIHPPSRKSALAFADEVNVPIDHRSANDLVPGPSLPLAQPSLLAPAPSQLPPKKSSLNFAISATSVRPAPALPKDLQVGDKELDDVDEEDENWDGNEDDDGEEDAEGADGEEDEDEAEEEDEVRGDEAGYEEDDEGEGSSDDSDGVASLGERRKYRYKREGIFGEDSSDEEEVSEEDELDGNEDSSLRTARSTRDSIISNFSGFLVDGSNTSLNGSDISLGLPQDSLKRRSHPSLRRRGIRSKPSSPLATFFPPSTSTSTDPNELASPSQSTLRKTPHFPSPLTLTQRHSNLPQSPVPTSGFSKAKFFSRAGGRGKGGYSPGLKRGGKEKNFSPGLKAPADRIGRDDFLPSHLKSEEGKAKEKQKELERKQRESDRAKESASGRTTGKSETEKTGGSGKVSRHRSPPPSGRESRVPSDRPRSRTQTQPAKFSTPPPPSSNDASTQQPCLPAPSPPPVSPRQAPTQLLMSPIQKPTAKLSKAFDEPSTDGWRSDDPVFANSRRGLRSTPSGRIAPTFLTDVEDTSSLVISPTTLAPSESVAVSLSTRRSSLTQVFGAFRRPAAGVSVPSYSTDASEKEGKGGGDTPMSSEASRRASSSVAVDGTPAIAMSASATDESDVGGLTSTHSTTLAQNLHRVLSSLSSPTDSTSSTPVTSAPSSVRTPSVVFQQHSSSNASTTAVTAAPPSSSSSFAQQSSTSILYPSLHPVSASHHRPSQQIQQQQQPQIQLQLPRPHLHPSFDTNTATTINTTPRPPYPTRSYYPQGQRAVSSSNTPTQNLSSAATTPTHPSPRSQSPYPQSDNTSSPSLPPINKLNRIPTSPPPRRAPRPIQRRLSQPAEETRSKPILCPQRAPPTFHDGF